MSYADLFYIYGPYKSCVYGVKLIVEFAILNRLRSLVGNMSRPTRSFGSTFRQTHIATSGIRLRSRSKPEMHVDTFDGYSHKSDTGMILRDVESRRHQGSNELISLVEGTRQTTEVVIESNRVRTQQ